MDVTHTFNSGVYTRTGRIEKGSVIVGFRHKVASVFTLATGRVLIHDNIHGLRDISAPFSEVTQPGQQRLGYVIETITGCNILQTEQTDVAGVEAEMFEPLEVTPELIARAQNLLA